MLIKAHIKMPTGNLEQCLATIDMAHKAVLNSSDYYSENPSCLCNEDMNDEKVHSNSSKVALKQ